MVEQVFELSLVLHRHAWRSIQRRRCIDHWLLLISLLAFRGVVLSNILYLGKHEVVVGLHLAVEVVILVFRVFLHEKVVLVEDFNGLVDLYYFASLYVLKVDLPL